ncbi:hypothetical protein CIRG_03714 [Coccidioides immitis RMSCC 2394]|uniref:Uncharacterized protein n=1 Tax=Coccidioides immitis RMSCC 2394 TaxID=404692 RepID=A0A0J6YB64_COCIT|nr:hypothetical protein CIRG_03714 [Coccidioides immitis RMSCC 2394]
MEAKLGNFRSKESRKLKGRSVTTGKECLVSSYYHLFLISRRREKDNPRTNKTSIPSHPASITKEAPIVRGRIPDAP